MKANTMSSLLTRKKKKKEENVPRKSYPFYPCSAGIKTRFPYYQFYVTPSFERYVNCQLII